MFPDDDDSRPDAQDNDFLENERRNDPMAFVKEYMKKAMEMMGAATRPCPPAMLLSNKIDVQKISNGYVVTYQESVPALGQGLPKGYFNVRVVQSFGKDFDETGAIVRRALEAAAELEKLTQGAICAGG